MVVGRFNSDRFEATLVVEAAPEAVWERLQRLDDGQPAWLSPWPRMPGFDVTGEVVSSSPPHQIQVHKTSEPCKDSQIRLTLAVDAEGTSVRVEQFDLPDWVHHALDVFVMGGNQIATDLFLYLNRGVSLSRHSMPWAFSGLMARESEGGLEVTALVPGTFAERIAVQPGDILLTLGGAPVFSQDSLQTLLRVLESGSEVTCSWLRDETVMRASAIL